MTHLLIVDDEALGCDRLVRLVREQHPDWKITTAADVTAAEAECRSADPAIALVLLDIEMPGESGLSWLSRLKESPEPPAVIMVTAWSEHALPAIQQGADGYLLKPVKMPELSKALEQAQKANRLQAISRTRIPLNLDGSGQYVDLASIQYCVAEIRWVRVVTDAAELVSDRPLKQWETDFGHCLVRAHRGFLFHRSAVAQLGREAGQYELTLTSGAVLPVSRRHVKAVRERLKHG